MARIRSIHPGLFTDERYMALSFPARELIKGIWCDSDDDGVFDWKPLTLKARIMPADNVDMVALLAELVAGAFITKVEQGAHEYGLVRNFRTFQRPKRPSSRGLLPPEYRTYVGLTAEDGEPPRDKPPRVPHKAGTGGGKSPQMEGREGGEEGRKKEGARANGAGGQHRPIAGTATPMTAGWKPGKEIQQFAAQKLISDAEVFRQAELFRDHYLANGEMRQDWQASFRKWLNSRGQFGDREPPAKPKFEPLIP